MIRMLQKLFFWYHYNSVINNQKIFKDKSQHGRRSYITFRCTLGLSGILFLNAFSLYLICVILLGYDINPLHLIFILLMTMTITVFYTSTQKQYKRLMIRNLRDYYFKEGKIGSKFLIY